MPGRQIFTFEPQSISASWRQPSDLRQLGERKPHAVRNKFFAPGIVAASATRLIEKLAGDAGVMDVAGVFILKLDKTASATAVA
jgi:hypothetical protein